MFSWYSPKFDRSGVNMHGRMVTQLKDASLVALCA